MGVWWGVSAVLRLPDVEIVPEALRPFLAIGFSACVEGASERSAGDAVDEVELVDKEPAGLFGRSTTARCDGASFWRQMRDAAPSAGPFSVPISCTVPHARFLIRVLSSTWKVEPRFRPCDEHVRRAEFSRRMGDEIVDRVEVGDMLCACLYLSGARRTPPHSP